MYVLDDKQTTRDVCGYLYNIMVANNLESIQIVRRLGGQFHMRRPYFYASTINLIYYKRLTGKKSLIVQ